MTTTTQTIDAEKLTYGTMFKAIKGGRTYRVASGLTSESVFQVMRDGSSKLRAMLINKDGSKGRDFKYFAVEEIKEIL